MPAAPGLSGFLETEWGRFWQGWDSLGPDAQARLEANRQMRQGAAGGTPTINLPGWNDVIHVSPAYQPTRAEGDEFYQARRENRPPLLLPHVVDAVQRRSDIMDRMASSAQPGYGQAFGSMLTALDNIQDALSTAATLGRLTAGYAAARLPLVSPALAARVGARLIPGIGWILGAADLLNLLTWLGLYSMIGYGLICGGLRGGLPPALVQASLRGVSGLRPCGGRGAVSAIAETNPFGSLNRLRNLSRAARAAPGFGALLEVAQTTDQLFGRGLSLGAIYGAVMEAAYAAVAAAQGQSFRVNPPRGSGLPVYRGPGGGTMAYADAMGALAEFGPGAHELVRELTGGALRARWQLARVLVDAPMLLTEVAILTMQERAQVLVAWLHAADAIGRDLAGADVDGLVTWGLGQRLGAGATVSDAVADALARTADAGASVGRWPLPGAPREALGADLAAHWSAELPVRVQELLEPIRETMAGMWLGSVINLVATRAFQTLTQESEPFRSRFAPDFVILASLTDASRYPDVTVGEDVLWGWWQELRGLVDLEERGSVLPAELDASALRHGVVLLYGEQLGLRESAL